MENKLWFMQMVRLCRFIYIESNFSAVLVNGYYKMVVEVDRIEFCVFR